MGSFASKATRSAAGASARKYPSRPSAASRASAPLNQPPPSSEAAAAAPGPRVHPPPRVSTTRDEAINLDASDPDFARNLRTIGPVTPLTTFSHSSTFAPPFPASSSSTQTSSSSSSSPTANQPSYPDPSANSALGMLAARDRIQQAADAEFQRVRTGKAVEREFLDVTMLRQIFMLRDDRGIPDEEIEKGLGLKGGVLKRLGRKGVVGNV